MTEAEWLTCADPTPMLELLRGKVSDRKLRLFAVTCCRELPQWVDAFSRKALKIIERYADGEVGEEKLGSVWDTAGHAAQRRGSVGIEREAQAMSAIAYAAEHESSLIVQAAVTAATAFAYPHGRSTYSEHREKQSHKLREILGNPFRPVTVDPRWLTSTVTALATGIYAERAFDRMPILADALEDAGCDHADILTHCRGDGPHVRGCWVVDLVLGKS